MDIVVELDVALKVVQIWEVTSEQLYFTCFVRDGALASKSFCHVVVLNVCKCLFGIFVPSAHQVMHVIYNRENACVHNHQIDKCSKLACEELVEVDVKDLDEGCQNDTCLGCC